MVLILYGTFRGSVSQSVPIDDAGNTHQLAIDAKREDIRSLEQKISSLRRNTASLKELLVSYKENDTIAKIDALEQELGLAEGGAAGKFGNNPVPGSGCTHPMIAIAVKTRHSTIADIEYFLDHHFSIGICHVFVRIQHTPNLRFLLSEPKYHGKVSPIWVNDYPIFEDDEQGESFSKKKLEFEKLLESEDTFVDAALQRAEKHHFSWVFSLDDDELLYDYAKNDISKFFENVPENIVEVHLQNYESLVDPEQIDTHIHHRFGGNLFYKGARLGYDQGKSAARVGSSVKQDGPYLFAVDGKQPSEFRKTMEPTDLVVLHYESSDFFAWIRKFSEYRTANVSLWPWKFYRDSHAQVEELREFYMSKKRASPAEAKLEKGAHAIGVDIAELVQLEDYSPDFYRTRPQNFDEYPEDTFRVVW